MAMTVIADTETDTLTAVLAEAECLFVAALLAAEHHNTKRAEREWLRFTERFIEQYGRKALTPLCAHFRECGYAALAARCAPMPDQIATLKKHSQMMRAAETLTESA